MLLRALFGLIAPQLGRVTAVLPLAPVVPLACGVAVVVLGLVLLLSDQPKETWNQSW